MAELTRGSFVDLLREEMGCNTDLELSTKLGIATGNWRAEAEKPLSKLILGNALHAIRKNLMSGCIRAITEFHYLNVLHGHNTDNFRKRVDDESVSRVMQAAQGVYAFYDTQGQMIYCGKTVGNNLLAEMEQAYKLPRPQYKKRLGVNGQIKVINLKIKDAAGYFSAYEISNLEAFVIRMAPNNLINRKLEKIKLAPK